MMGDAIDNKLDVIYEGDFFLKMSCFVLKWLQHQIKEDQTNKQYASTRQTP